MYLLDAMVDIYKAMWDACHISNPMTYKGGLTNSFANKSSKVAVIYILQKYLEKKAVQPQTKGI